MGGAALLAISALLSLTYLSGRPVRRRTPGMDWRRVAVKAGSVFLLAVYSYAFGGPWLLVLALLFGSLGDAFLVGDGKAGFIGGLASFLVAHLLYAALFWPPHGFGGFIGSPLQIGIGLLSVAWAMLLLRMVWPGASGLRLPILLYAAAILAMTLSAVSTERIGVIIGAVLFFASDSVLALEKFRIPPPASVRRMTAPFVWASYYLAQLTIMLSWLYGR